jgi:hypothetical protein
MCHGIVTEGIVRCLAPRSELLSWASNMAGFEVTLHGRIWVTPEGRPYPDNDRQFRTV